MLANISVIWEVESEGFLFGPVAFSMLREDFLLLAGETIGSTWTICSQVCTIALIKDVFPTPESPATSTLRRPMPLPVSVNGRRLGIWMLGMTSWGALPLSIMDDTCCRSGSSSSSELTAISEMEPDNEFRLEDGVLMMDPAYEVPRVMGVMGRDKVWKSCDRMDAGLCVATEARCTGDAANPPSLPAGCRGTS